MAMGSKAFESPLISHVRMRALYRALVEMRALAAERRERSYRGVEACWVGTAIDLQVGDLTFDAGGRRDTALLDHIRAVGRRTSAEPVKPSEMRRILRRMEEAAAVFPGTAAERVLCAAGAALALKATAPGQVAMAYAGLRELTPEEWLRILTVMGQEGLPLVLFVLPARKSSADLEMLARRVARRNGQLTPVIPVDAGDVVAIYRVAQETILRARQGGGSAVIQALACGTDAVKLMGAQLVRKRICTERWVDAVATHLNKLAQGKPTQTV